MKKRDWTVTATELAAVFSVSRPRIVQLKSEGLPTLKNGRFDLRAAVAWRFASLKDESGDDPELRRWRKARADLAEHQLAVTRGEFYPKDEEDLRDVNKVIEVRTALMALGQSLTPAIVGLDQTAVRKLINDRCRQICEAFARNVAAEHIGRCADESEREELVTFARDEFEKNGAEFNETQVREAAKAYASKNARASAGNGVLAVARTKKQEIKRPAKSGKE